MAVPFGIATLASGGNVLFGSGAQGAAAPLAVGLAGATALAFAALAWHISLGGAYETRTVFAMTLRLGLWLGIALLAIRFDASQPRCGHA